VSFEFKTAGVDPSRVVVKWEKNMESKRKSKINGGNKKM
jgi:hypothetical protein